MRRGRRVPPPHASALSTPFEPAIQSLSSSSSTSLHLPLPSRSSISTSLLTGRHLGYICQLLNHSRLRRVGHSCGHQRRRSWCKVGHLLKMTQRLTGACGCRLKPYTRHPTPDTRHPTPDTLHPTLLTTNRKRKCLNANPPPQTRINTSVTASMSPSHSNTSAVRFRV